MGATVIIAVPGFEVNQVSRFCKPTPTHLSRNMDNWPSIKCDIMPFDHVSKEVHRFILHGKDSAWPFIYLPFSPDFCWMVVVKGDEDEGSPPQGGANPAACWREKIE
jgi:hypothetical protein